MARKGLPKTWEESGAMLRRINPIGPIMTAPHCTHRWTATEDQAGCQITRKMIASWIPV